MDGMDYMDRRKCHRFGLFLLENVVHGGIIGSRKERIYDKLYLLSMR